MKNAGGIRTHLLETVRIAGLAAIIFVALFWGADCRCLWRVSDTLSDIQDKTLDYLSRFEHLRYGPSLPDTTPPVRLIQLDDATVTKYSQGSYVFNRGTLARVLEALETSTPRAVFIDLDLSRASNEPVAGRVQRSQGDQAFLNVLRRKPFPVLFNTALPLEDSTLLGAKPSSLGVNICWVSPFAIRDQDGNVRRIPRRVAASDPLPASEALHRFARGDNPCVPGREAQRRTPYAFQDAYGGIGNRMVFREPELWQGFSRLSGVNVLEDAMLGVFDDAIVLIGRTDRESGDEHLTPVGRIPGVLLHVNELMTMLSYGRKVTPLSPFWGALLAFAFVFVSMLVTPPVIRWLSGIITRQRRKRDPDAADTKLENFLERPVIWFSLFVIAALTLHQSGIFVDFAFPILALELARVLEKRRVPMVATRVLRWGLRRQ
jgi:CHASE2 domain-containing sensor protein